MRVQIKSAGVEVHSYPGAAGHVDELPRVLTEMLEMAQNMYGDCEHDMKVSGISFKDTSQGYAPQTCWDNEACTSATIVLSSAAAKLESAALAELGHECGHLLSPSYLGQTTRLEEGICSHLAKTYFQVMGNDNYATWLKEKSSYHYAALEKVEDLLGYKIESIKNLRKKFGRKISEITAGELLGEVPALPQETAIFLTERFCGSPPTDNDIVERVALEVNAGRHSDFIKQAYKQWHEWNRRLFSNYFGPNDVPLIILKPMLTKEIIEGAKHLKASEIEDQTLAKIAPMCRCFFAKELFPKGYSSPSESCSKEFFGGMPPVYTLCENSLEGTNGLLHAESDFKEGRFKYMNDAMLHEMTHHPIMKILGTEDWKLKPETEQKEEKAADEADRAYSANNYWQEVRKQHTKLFAHIANNVCRALNVHPVKYVLSQTKHESRLCDSHIGFIHNVRTREYYDFAISNLKALKRPEHCPNFSSIQIRWDDCPGCNSEI